ncbi:hypothetical protein BDV10DRAFT_155596 [Aspergillus recurvatus]
MHPTLKTKYPGRLTLRKEGVFEISVIITLCLFPGRQPHTYSMQLLPHLSWSITRPTLVHIDLPTVMLLLQPQWSLRIDHVAQELSRPWRTDSITICFSTFASTSFAQQSKHFREPEYTAASISYHSEWSDGRIDLEQFWKWVDIYREKSEQMHTLCTNSYA